MGQDYYAGGDELNRVTRAPNPVATHPPTPPEEEEEPLPKLPGPPSYEALRKWEDELPQHNLDLPFPEGRTGRYVKFSTQMNLVGWNNCLNERCVLFCFWFGMVRRFSWALGFAVAAFAFVSALCVGL
jgi:hypothetical protein